MSQLNRTLSKRLEALEKIVPARNQMIDPAILMEIVAISQITGKEISVYLNRYGRVAAWFAGSKVACPLARTETAGEDFFLTGLRCVHTHPQASGDLSDEDVKVLLENHLDAMIAVGMNKEGEIIEIGCAFYPLPGEQIKKEKYYLPEFLKLDFPQIIRKMEESFRKAKKLKKVEAVLEQAYLFGVDLNERDLDLVYSMNELQGLAETAGLRVVGTEIQKREKLHNSLYMGSGKLQEIALSMQQTEADILIVNAELSPIQLRNLETALNKKVIDRSMLILDIFAQRAQSKEGKIQVELAQLKYMMPRLTGKGVELSRLGGGIGTRGPGETKLETDKRMIRKRLLDLERRLEKVRQNREVKSKKQKKHNIPKVALVGYTNAGKSSLMKRLTGQEVLVEDKLFATLDTKTSLLKLPAGKDILLADTVGFIHQLPTHLIAAFRSTLEETVEADLLLHVVDASDLNIAQNIQTVESILTELGCEKDKQLLIFNKWDLIDEKQDLSHLAGFKPALKISAQTGVGEKELLSLVEKHIFGNWEELAFLLSYDQQKILDEMYHKVEILEKEYAAEGILLRIKVPAKEVSYWQKKLEI